MITVAIGFTASNAAPLNRRRQYTARRNAIDGSRNIPFDFTLAAMPATTAINSTRGQVAGRSSASASKLSLISLTSL